MKRYAIHSKNIAALLMLLALISLLLPFCKVKTPNKSINVSGVQIVKIGAKLSAEYIKEGTIKNEYVIADHLTWGDLKTGAGYATMHQEVQKAVLAGVICLLPVLFCFLAMIATFIAEGKKTMFFPTILLIATVVENIVLILGFPKLQDRMLSYAGGTGISLGLLFGISAFTVLCAIALGVILVLWVSGGFDRPDPDENESKRRGREKSSDGRRRRKKRRKKKKSSKKSKRDKEKKESKETESKSNNENVVPLEQPGILRGCSGLYDGIKMDLTKAGTATIGTTPEAIEIIKNGSVSSLGSLAGCNFVIQYDHLKKQYRVTNHSVKEIRLMSGGNRDQAVNLGNGASATVGRNTMLLVGNIRDAIRLN